MLVPLNREKVVLATDRKRDLRSYGLRSMENVLGLCHSLARHRTTQHAITRRSRIIHAGRRDGPGYFIRTRRDRLRGTARTHPKESCTLQTLLPVGHRHIVVPLVSRWLNDRVR